MVDISIDLVQFEEFMYIGYHYQKAYNDAIRSLFM